MKLGRNLELFISPTLGKGYRRYWDIISGVPIHDHWFTIGPFTFRWYSLI